MTFIKKWRRASIALTLFINFASTISPLSAAVYGPKGPMLMLTSSFYAIGLGAHYMSDMLVSTMDSFNGCISERKGDVLHKVKTIAVQSLVRFQLERSNERARMSKELNTILLSAFDAGTRLPMMVDFYHVTADVVNDFYTIGTQLATDALYAMKDGAQLSYESVVNGLFDPVHRASDMPYPLRSYHGTNLHCGGNDRYCFYKQEREKPELESNPDQLVINLFKLGIEGGGISLGILMSILSYKVGNEIMKFLNAHGAKVFDGQASASASQHLVYDCVDAAVIEELAETVHDSLPVLEDITPGDTSSVLDINDIQEAMRFGEKGRRLAHAPPVASPLVLKVNDLFNKLRHVRAARAA